MVSTDGELASTSQSGVRVDASALEALCREHGDDVCILDCSTSDGPSLRGAYRIRLPNVLLRRLQNGTLALSTVSPRLTSANAPQLRVVVVPGVEADERTSEALANSLQRENFHFYILTEPVVNVLAKCASLRPDEHCQLSARGSNDIACLNLNTLRIECDPKGREKSKQVFPVRILPHLFLGNAETAANEELLKRYGITSVINCTRNLPNAFENDPHFRYLRISVDDNSSHNLIQFFPQAISFIESARSSGGATLVHCLAGISRSVTICIAYLMATQKSCLDSAYDLILRCNASIAPNFHFMGQLNEYEKLLGVKSNSLGTYAVTPRSPCAIEASSSLLTPPPTSYSSNSASPHSSTNSSKSFD